MIIAVIATIVTIIQWAVAYRPTYMYTLHGTYSNAVMTNIYHGTPISVLSIQRTRRNERKKRNERNATHVRNASSSQ